LPESAVSHLAELPDKSVLFETVSKSRSNRCFAGNRANTHQMASRL
jgi:hypothetical protein